MSGPKLFHFHGTFKKGGVDYVYVFGYVESLAVLVCTREIKEI